MFRFFVILNLTNYAKQNKLIKKLINFTIHSVMEHDAINLNTKKNCNKCEQKHALSCQTNKELNITTVVKQYFKHCH